MTPSAMSPALAAPAIPPLPALPAPVRPAPPARPAPAPPRPDAARLIDQLHSRHAGELLRFCRWMLRDPDDAADAVQDTWIRAMAALRDERIRVASLRPWLYAIARNACVDRLRERRRASEHELDEAALGGSPAADEVAGLRQEATAALALVGSLSERQRSALLMREVAGMSMPEIASALGCSADRAAWTIADARRALAESRAGGGLECDDVRARLHAGHRGRALRAHLGSCAPCASYDRSQRARRLLAPALLPWLWLRREGAAALLKPALATVAVAASVAQPPIVPEPPAPAPAVRPASGSEAAALRSFAAPATGRAPSARESIAGPRRPVRVAPRRAAARVPAVAPAATGGPKGGAAAPGAPAKPPAPTLVGRVAQRVDTVASRATAALPPAGRPLRRAAATATAAVQALATRDAPAAATRVGAAVSAVAPGS